MAAKHRLRKRFFVDYRVQGALIVRIVLYWLICLLTMMFLLLGWDMIKDPNRPLNAHLAGLWAVYGSTAVASLVLLPAVIFDILRLSNRFAGPLFRLRRSMHDLAQGRPVAAVRFRQGDFWQEFADDFDTVAARAKEAKRPPDPISPAGEDDFLPTAESENDCGAAVPAARKVRAQEGRRDARTTNLVGEDDFLPTPAEIGGRG